jgi:hypothetical protein
MSQNEPGETLLGARMEALFQAKVYSIRRFHMLFECLQGHVAFIVVAARFTACRIFPILPVTIPTPAVASRR